MTANVPGKASLVMVDHMKSFFRKADIEAERLAAKIAEQDREHRRQLGADMAGAIDRVRSLPGIYKGSGLI